MSGGRRDASPTRAHPVTAGLIALFALAGVLTSCGGSDNQKSAATTNAPPALEAVNRVPTAHEPAEGYPREPGPDDDEGTQLAPATPRECLQKIRRAVLGGPKPASDG